jgi:hypothetical protein
MMKTLRTEIPKAFPAITDLSGEGRTVDRDRLVNVLDGLAANLKRAYWIRLSIGIIIFVVLIFFMFRYANNPSGMAAVVAATGITIGGTIAAIKQVTDEMARVGLLLAIAPEMTLEALTEMAKSIATKL